MQMRTLLLPALLFAGLAFAADPPPVYWLLWFDTEDYIDPASDDAALRLARELDAMGVKATFKIVGEKARVLEERGRRDVIAALSKHDIGYHTDNHSIPPTPAVYLQKLGMADGAALSHGHTVHAIIGPAGRPARLPDRMKDLFA